MALAEHPLHHGFGTVVESDDDMDVLDLTTDGVMDMLRRRSVVLLRGFVADRERFVTFSRRYCNDFLPITAFVGPPAVPQDAHGHYADDLTHTVLVMNRGGPAVPLTGDAVFVRRKPNMLFVLCENAGTGGRALIADGVAVWKDLSREAKSRFEDQRLIYHRLYPAAQWHQLFGTEDHEAVRALCAANDTTTEFRDDGTLVVRYTGTAVSFTQFSLEPTFFNALLPFAEGRCPGETPDDPDHPLCGVTLPNGDPVPDDLLTEARRAVAAHTVPVAWQAGDVMLLDSTRLLLGREAVPDNGRSVVLRLGRSDFAAAV